MLRWWCAAARHKPHLVHALAGVVRVHVLIRGAEVAPLEAVHRPEVPHLAVRQTAPVEELTRRVAVPDPDALVLEQLGIGRAGHEPEQLLRKAAPEHALGGEEGELVVAKGVAHLHPELGEGPGASPIAAQHAVVDDVADDVKVLQLLWFGFGRWWGGARGGGVGWGE